MGWFFLCMILALGFDQMTEAQERTAKAIETQSGETACRLDPKDESAVANGDLPNPRIGATP